MRQSGDQHKGNTLGSTITAPVIPAKKSARSVSRPGSSHQPRNGNIRFHRRLESLNELMDDSAPYRRAGKDAASYSLKGQMDQ